MSIIDNQEILIEQTQELYSRFLNSNQISEAIAISKVLVDLSASYKDIGGIPVSVSRPIETVSQLGNSPFGTPLFSEAKTRDAINQSLRESTRPRFEQVTVRPKPQPSVYAWSDGFHGVTVPERETHQALPAPQWINENPEDNRNNANATQPDYWRDERRQ